MNKKIVHEVFDSVAGLHSGRTAVVDQHTTINYRELKEASDEIALCLRGAGIMESDNVVVFSGSGVSYVATILGVNKAGGVFIPVEPHLPEKRITEMMGLAAPRFLVTTEDLLQHVLDWQNTLTLSSVECILTISVKSGSLEIFGYDSTGESVPLLKDEKPLPTLTGDHPNYLLFTSGSTGSPKAVLGAHKSLSHFIHWEMKEFELGPEVKVAQLAPLAFDVSLRDIFVPLLAGGALCIPPSETKVSPENLIVWCNEHQVNLLHMVPSVFRAMTQTLDDSPDLISQLSGVRYVMLAGEALYSQDVKAWRSVMGTDTELVNLYGPSETTLAKLFYRIDDVSDFDGVLPLGQPIGNTAVLILDRNELCDVGKVGEICIKTPFRSLGYYKDAASLNEKNFVQNPLHDDFEDIIYKTGDMGRYREDWSVEFVGRKDSQVKIRGNRVDLMEIENLALKVPGIDQVVIKAITGKDNQLVICCYFATTIDDQQMRDHLKQIFAENFPDYMFPSFYVPVDKFPVNLNGKIDRRSLAKPEELHYQLNAFEEPKTETEKRLSGIWSDVIGIEKISRTSSFFELGGHSLSATILISKLYKLLSVEVTLKEFFDHPTLKSLATLIESKDIISYEKIPQVLEKSDYAVSHAQKGVFIAHQQNGKQYNMQDSFLIKGDFETGLFDEALHALLKRHEILRTSFVSIGGEPRQRVHAVGDFSFRIEYDDLRDNANKIEDSRKIAKLASEEIFDLRKAPLLRAKVLRLEEDLYVLLLTTHHIVSDGWSKELMVKEVINLYNAFRKKEEVPLKSLRIQYKDFSAWQNVQIQKDLANPHHAYWAKMMKDPAPPVTIKPDFERKGFVRGVAGHMLFDLGEELSDQLHQLAARHNASLFNLLLTLVKVLMYRYSGSKDIMIGTPVAGREHPDLHQQIGLYVNTLLLRSDLDTSLTFTDFLQRVKQLTLEAHQHQIYPFDTIVEMQKREGNSQYPLHSVMVQLLNSVESGEERMEGVEIKRFIKGEGASQNDIYMHFMTEEKLIMVDIEYDTNLYKNSTIDFLKFNLISICQLCVSNPAESIEGLVSENLEAVFESRPEINVSDINF